MKRYLVYFLCFTLCLFSTPTLYSLLPARLKPSPDPDGGEEKQAAAYSESGFPDVIKVYRTASGRVESIPIEEYVAGVLYAELPPETPFEMQKSMAVVIRTYAVYHALCGDKGHDGADVCDNGNHCRAYDGGGVAKSISAAAYATRGEIILYDGRVIDPISHTMSFGETEDASDAFGAAVPYLKSVATPDPPFVFAGKYDNFYKTVELSKNEFASLMESGGYPIDKSTNHVNWISYMSKSQSGRVKSAFICGYEVPGKKLAEILSLTSTAITVVTGANGFVFTSEGIGHGVGFCEYGAWSMAEAGKTYREIIVHYFQGSYIADN